MSVGRICSRRIDQIEQGAPVRTAAQRMTARNVGTLVVMTPEGDIAGLLTDRDLAVRVVGEGRDPHITRVQDVMTQHPYTVPEQTPVEDALALMRVRGVRRMPVLNGESRLIGVVSMDDILALLAREFGDLSLLIEASSPDMLAHCQPWCESNTGGN